MHPAQAVALAVLALEWEAETAAAARNRAWLWECQQAAKVLRALAASLPSDAPQRATSGFAA